MSETSDTLKLAEQFISRQSVTPEDAGCQDLMIERLSAIGFKVEKLRFEDVDNIWLRRGDTEPL
ncbi:MAG: succinyl-diaminopimelate desuccinylase, partial [Gammaproteobacteria bacterium]|nr:succinyl-diaminopimelate desuccinylase [Gammaproteobacteria bacterium]